MLEAVVIATLDWEVPLFLNGFNDALCLFVCLFVCLQPLMLIAERMSEIDRNGGFVERRGIE